MFTKNYKIINMQIPLVLVLFIGIFSVRPARGAPALLDPAKVSFQEVGTGLSQPLAITHAGDGSGRLFIVERSGRIRILKNGMLLTTPFLDIQSLVRSTSSEQGLLTLAFHPLYASNGKFYVVYTALRNGDSSGSILTLRQYTVSTGNLDLADPNSGISILTIDHPTYSNHNGGALSFGNDGYLYWSTGDGGGAGDPNNNGQNLTSLLGKILRMDVNTSSPYAIPASNPFYNSADPGIKKEIWAYGLRNPWRMSFDRITHDLYIGDVGQSVREEIDFQRANGPGGENYGWRIMEGSLCYNPASGCNQSGKILPVAEYNHSLGCSVTGGYVYRGPSYPSLSGYYLYGDYCSGRIFSTYNNLPSGWSTPVQLADTAYFISTFGEDEGGELYLADYFGGKIYRIQYQESTYTILGNAGAGGVALNYMDGVGKTAIASPNGGYIISVPLGWSGTVTPSHTCYDFSPVDRTYNNVTINQISQDFTTTIKSGCANVNILVDGILKGIHGIPSGGYTFSQYVNVVDGPVKVISTNATDMFTTQIVTSGGSYNELAGYPVDQFTTEYWFPYYDHGYPNVAGNKMRTWILVGNPDPSLTANVEIRIGGVLKNDPANPSNFFFSIPPGGNVTPRWLGLVGGPVQVKSTNGVNIFASERVFTVPYNSFNEVMGYPANQFTTEYWFPWYDTVYMDTYVMVGNTSSSISANVDIYIGATKKGSYSILPNATLKQRYASTLAGPVRVVSTNGVNIVASEFTLSGTENSFNEVMGYPFNQFDTEYWYPYYDHGYPSVNGNKMRTWILVGNPSSTLTANVQIYIKGNLQTVPGSNPATTTFVIPPSGNVTPRWMGSIAGPVRVVSDIPIFTSERVFTVPTNAFNEFMGIPFSQMTTEYWFPWYDSVYMNNKVLVSKP